MLAPHVASKDRFYGMEFVQHMLTQTKNNIEGLPDKSQVHE